MAEIQTIVNSLLARAASVDPVMLSILQEMLNEINRLGIIIDPPATVPGKFSTPIKNAPGSANTFTFELTKYNVILSWTEPTPDFVFYELREGIDWDTATHILVTGNRQVFLDPITVGTHTYLLRTLNTQGTYGPVSELVVVIPPIGSFIIVPEVAVNNVLLRWNEPESTFAIDYYILYKNGTELTRTNGQFFAYAESAGNTYNYSIVAVDIAGNVSDLSQVNTVVAGFPDFVLRNTLTSTYSGTKNNAIIHDGKLYVAFSTTETYQVHFTSRGWTSPADQVAAGYPVWSSPYVTTAYYEEIFDFGLIYTNVVISLNWKFLIESGTWTFGIDARTSVDNITYSGAFTTPSFFASAVRYVKVRMNFTGNNDKALMAFFNFTASLSVRREMDAGAGTADASDTLGTVVLFNKAFKDIEGITIAAMSTTTVIPVVEFIDIPNPTQFKVKIYDNAGVRKTVDFRWDARGVL